MRCFVYCRKSSESEDRQALSLESQRASDLEFASKNPNLQIVEVLEEAMSAKKPGRPVFNYMMDRIEAGEADAIITWHPDRLARNALDGGRVIMLLDSGRLKALHCVTGAVDNSPQGKLMLSMLLGFAKYYSDALSENVKRGLRSKAEKGWRPSKPPIGYLTDSVSREIIKDPDRYDIVRGMWELMLTGAYAPSAILEIATHQWGLRTKERKRSGGTHVSLSTVYSIFGNPFYSGMFQWAGQLLPGKHVPMVNPDQFRQVQRLLSRPFRSQAKYKDFAYTGLIHCGCGLGVTAEEKTKPSGARYTYYHCTRKRLPRCTESYVRVEALEADIRTFLSSLAFPQHVREAVRKLVDDERDSVLPTKELALREVDSRIQKATAEMQEYSRMRAKLQISEEEFLASRREIETERLTLSSRRLRIVNETDWLEPFEIVEEFCNKAAIWFEAADVSLRRLILDTVGSNLVLRSGKLSIEAKLPFISNANAASIPTMCTFLKSIRTLSIEKDPELAKIVANIRKIREALGDSTLQKRAA